MSIWYELNIWLHFTVISHQSPHSYVTRIMLARIFQIQKSSQIFTSKIFRNLQKSSKIVRNFEKSSPTSEKKLGMLVGSRASTDFAPSLVTSRKSSSRASRQPSLDGKIGEKIWKTYGPTEPFTSFCPLFFWVEKTIVDVLGRDFRWKSSPRTDFLDI